MIGLPMSQYLVAKSRFSNGAFDVHLATCEVVPSLQRHPLGIFVSVGRALEEARKLYPRSQACSRCCASPIHDEPNRQHAVTAQQAAHA